jgi:hypothetical protein
MGNLTSLGFDPQTAQSMASHYTNYAIPAHGIAAACCHRWYRPSVLRDNFSPRAVEPEKAELDLKLSAKNVQSNGQPYKFLVFC